MFKFDIEKNDKSLENKKIVQIKRVKEISRKTNSNIGTHFIVSTCSFNDNCIHSLSCNEDICPYKISKDFYYTNRQTETIKKRHKKTEIFHLFGKDADFFEENLINKKEILTEEEILNLIKITNYDLKNIFSYIYVNNEKRYNNNILNTLKKSLSANQSKEANPRVVETYLQSYKNENFYMFNQNYKNFEKVVLKEIIKNIDMPLEESKTLLLITKTLEDLQKDNIFNITGDKIIFDITFLSSVLKSFESFDLLQMLKDNNLNSLNNYKDEMFLSKLDIDRNEIKIKKKGYMINDYYFICDNVKEIEKYKNIIFDFIDVKNNYLNPEILYSEFKKYSIQKPSSYVENELRNNFWKYYPKLKSEAYIIKNFINQEMVKTLSCLKEFKLMEEVRKTKEIEIDKTKNKIRDISNDISL